MGTIVIFLDKTSVSPWTVPVDWNASANTIEVGGAGGGTADDNVAFVGPLAGAGGGAYSSVSNIALTPGASISFVVGVGGGHSAAPYDGGDTWFGNAVYASSIVAAKGGGGNDGVTALTTSKAGGAAASGIGTVTFSGGNSSTPSGGAPGSGGGGAGANGIGVNGVGGGGGSGDNSFGGAGGSTGTAGGNGIEYDATHGWGGGGGAGSNTATGGGGKYGGGAGGNRLGKVGGLGADGLIRITYNAPVTFPKTLAVSVASSVAMSRIFTRALSLFVTSAITTTRNSAISKQIGVTVLGVVDRIVAVAKSFNVLASIGARKTIFLDASSISPWAVPFDWNPDNNVIAAIGIGGGTIDASNLPVGGGGGGGYAAAHNVALTPGGMIPFVVPLSSVGGGSISTTFGSTIVSANGGQRGSVLTGGVGGGGLVGNVRFAGGAGHGPVTPSGGSGGGAGGPNGQGIQGLDVVGGDGDASFGGVGAAQDLPGNPGSEFGARGSGGGAGPSSTNGSRGGNYGGGASGPAMGYLGAAGGNGLIVIQYTALISHTVAISTTLAVAGALTAAAVRSTGHVLAVSASTTVSIVWNIRHTLQLFVLASASVARQCFIAVSRELTSTTVASLIKQAQSRQVIASSTAVTSHASMVFSRILNVAVTTATVAARAVNAIRQVNVSSLVSLGTRKAAQLSIQIFATSNASMTKSVGSIHTITTVSQAVTMVRTVLVARAVAVALTTLLSARSITKSIEISATTSLASTKKVTKGFAVLASVTVSSLVGRLIFRTLDVLVTTTTLTGRAVSLVRSVPVITTAAATKLVTKTFSMMVTNAASSARTINKAFAMALTTAISLPRIVSHGAAVACSTAVSTVHGRILHLILTVTAVTSSVSSGRSILKQLGPLVTSSVISSRAITAHRWIFVRTHAFTTFVHVVRKFGIHLIGRATGAHIIGKPN